MIVHRLYSDPLFVVTASSDERTILGAQSCGIDQGGTKNSFKTAGNSGVQLINMDGLEDAVVVTTTSFPYGANKLNIGDKGALTCVMAPVSDGSGAETGSTLTKTWTYAVVEKITAGPTIEGSPSYSITFACKPLTNA